MPSRKLAIIAAIVAMLPVMVCAEETEKPHLREVSLLTASKLAPLPKLSEVDSERPAPKTISPTPDGRKRQVKQSRQAFPSAPLKEANREQDKRKEGHVSFSPGMVLPPPVTVLPEVTTAVWLSALDLNRIICPDGDIKEALTSDEKGLMIKITGKDAFVKFKVGKQSDGKLAYSSTPTEIYLVCGGATYSMVAYPDRMPSQTIKLSSGTENRIKENEALYAGLPFEKRIMKAIKEVYTDKIPESYTVTQLNKVDLSWKGLLIALRREVDVEGQGMLVKEYHLALKHGQKEPVKLSEKMFLRKEFALNPIAVSIDKHTLRPGDTSRLFIVEQRPDKPLGSGFMLPSVEGGETPPSAEQKPTQNSMPPFGKGTSRPGAKLPSMTEGGLR